MARTISTTKPESKSAHSLSLHSYSPDNSDERRQLKGESNDSNAGCLSSRSRSPDSNSNNSSHSSCSTMSSQRMNSDRRWGVEIFGNTQHKRELEEHDRNVTQTNELKEWTRKRNCLEQTNEYDSGKQQYYGHNHGKQQYYCHDTHKDSHKQSSGLANISTDPKRHNYLERRRENDSGKQQ